VGQVALYRVGCRPVARKGVMGFLQTGPRGWPADASSRSGPPSQARRRGRPEEALRQDRRSCHRDGRIFRPHRGTVDRHVKCVH